MCASFPPGFPFHTHVCTPHIKRHGSAVDNILLKLKETGVRFLRLGRPVSVHPGVRDGIPGGAWYPDTRVKALEALSLNSTVVRPAGWGKAGGVLRGAAARDPFHSTGGAPDATRCTANCFRREAGALPTAAGAKQVQPNRQPALPPEPWGMRLDPKDTTARHPTRRSG